MIKRTMALAAICTVVSTACAFGVANARSGSGPRPSAIGSQQIASSPGVYAQTTVEYAPSWDWRQDSASFDYYWYIFTSGGTLTASGHKASGGGGSWSGAANIYYFKEYNNEPVGSGHINILSVSYCC